MMQRRCVISSTQLTCLILCLILILMTLRSVSSLRLILILVCVRCCLFPLSSRMLRRFCVMAKKFRKIIGAFVLRFFSRENVSALIDQLIDALYERGDGNKDV